MNSREARDRFVREFCAELERQQGKNLVAIVLYGSQARGEARPDSDIDLLVVCEQLQRSRLQRTDILLAVKRDLAPALRRARAEGVEPYLSTVFKTRKEAGTPSLLYLDLVEDARILFDRDGFFAGVLAELRRRLLERGARRIRAGDRWYWDLKPDYRPGDVFEMP